MCFVGIILIFTYPAKQKAMIMIKKDVQTYPVYLWDQSTTPETNYTLSDSEVGNLYWNQVQLKPQWGIQWSSLHESWG